MSETKEVLERCATLLQATAEFLEGNPDGWHTHFSLLPDCSKLQGAAMAPKKEQG